MKTSGTSLRRCGVRVGRSNVNLQISRRSNIVKSSATSPYDSHLAVIAVRRLIRHGDVLFGSMQYSEGEVNENPKSVCEKDDREPSLLGVWSLSSASFLRCTPCNRYRLDNSVRTGLRKLVPGHR